MRKKTMALLLGIIGLAVLLGGCGGKEATKTTLYGDKKLHPETVALLDNPLYQNIVLPDQLNQWIEREEDLYVYFFSPTCPHCIKTTPIVAPIAKEFGVHLLMYNVLEFEQGWRDYSIQGTPTLVHFVGGGEVNRIVGAVSANEFRTWFQEQKAGPNGISES